MGQYSHSDLSHCNTMLAFPVIDSAVWLFWRLTAEQLDISNLIFMILFYVPDHRKRRTVVQSYSVFCCHFIIALLTPRNMETFTLKIIWNDQKSFFVNEVCNCMPDESQQTLVSRENFIKKCSGKMHQQWECIHSFIHSFILFIYFSISKDALN